MKQRNKRISLFLSITLVCTLTLMNLTGCFIKDKLNPTSEDDEADFEQIAEVNDSISEVKNSKEYLSGDKKAQTELLLKEIQKQAKSGKIKSDSIICDEENHIISFRYSNGVLGFDKGSTFDNELDNVKDSPKFITGDQLFPAKKDGKKADAVILNAMTDRTNVMDTCKKLADEWSTSGINTKLDDTVTLDDLVSLREYEFVYVKTHGRYASFSGSDGKIPCVSLEEKKNKKTDKKYKTDIKKNNSVGYCTDNTYFITPDFFKAHYKADDLSGSIFFFGCCELMGAHGSKVSTHWEKVLKKLSVSAFVGFYNSNHTYYNLDLVTSFMDHLIKGDTAKEAFEKATDECGETDITWYQKKYGKKPDDIDVDAYPILKLNEKATLKWEDGENSDSTQTDATTGTTVKSLTNDQALKAITNYIYINYPEIKEYVEDKSNENKAPCYWDIDEEESNDTTAVVAWRSYTAAWTYYYIDRVSGETKTLVYPPHLTKG
ncbi:MAG: hypothetical protein E7386_01115, partial [Ruminococcaceae bacterium]|nr:hypothetical protein [Oscillospiraceae bacterium]